LSKRLDYYNEPNSKNIDYSGNEHYTNLCKIGRESIQAIEELIGMSSLFLSDNIITTLENLIDTEMQCAQYCFNQEEYLQDMNELVETSFSSVLAEAKNALVKMD
jgi:hypothetical protein